MSQPEADGGSAAGNEVRPGEPSAGTVEGATAAGATVPGGESVGDRAVSGGLADGHPAAGTGGTEQAARDPVPPPVGAARRSRTERAVHGTLSAALILEALTILFVPRAIAPLDDEGLTGGRLAFLLGLAGALVVASGLQRRKAGLVLGSVLQVPVVATGFLVGVMFVLGLLFAGVWIYLLRIRHELLGAARSSAGP